jgi:hypothetical protein
MIVLQDGILVTQRGRIVTLASMVRLPDIHSVRDAVLVGGFLSYRIGGQFREKTRGQMRRRLDNLSLRARGTTGPRF